VGRALPLGRRHPAGRFANARLVEVPDARTFAPLDAPEVLAEEIAALAHAAAH